MRIEPIPFKCECCNDGVEHEEIYFNPRCHPSADCQVVAKRNGTVDILCAVCLKLVETLAVTGRVVGERKPD